MEFFSPELGASALVNTIVVWTQEGGSCQILAGHNRERIFDTQMDCILIYITNESNECIY
jgi:hypothetical protein